MTSTNDAPGGANDDLQFDVAEPTTPAGTPRGAGVMPCAACGQPITSNYYAVGSRPICSNCAAKVNTAPPGNRASRLGLATLYGIGAAIVGAIIWYVIRRVTHYEIGYIAILVGFMVGKAVRKGSGNRGGRAYQVLALVLTYCSIGANYAPDVVSGIVDAYHEKHSQVATAQPSDTGVQMATPAKKEANKVGQSVPDEAKPASATPEEKPSIGRALIALVVLVALVAGISLAAPFLAGFQNIIGLLIIGFALFQAWKMNRARNIPITGPYQLGQPGAGVVV